MDETIIINGQVKESSNISIDDRGFTLGDGLFETIPLYKGKPFGLDDHFKRLKSGADNISLNLPLSGEELSAAINSLVAGNGIAQGVARLTVSRGEGPRGYGISGCDNPVWILTVRPYQLMDEKKRAMGFSLKPVSLRKNPVSPLHAVKAISSLEKIIALKQAHEFDCDEALTLTVEGFISSGAAVNIFWIREGRLETPAPSCAILPGVTRKFVMDMAPDMDLEVVEGRFYLETLEEADEVFVTNSLLELVPVNKIKGLFGSSTPGIITNILHQAYRKSIESSSE